MRTPEGNLSALSPDRRLTAPSRYAWIPVPVLLAAMLGLRLADLRTAYDAPFLQMGLYFVTSTLVSIFVAWVIGRSFLVRRTPGKLLLGCGVLIWGASAFVSVVATLVQGGASPIDVNTQVTIHNLCVLFAALCHLTGTACSMRWKHVLSSPAAWLGCAYPGALALVAGIVYAAGSGLTPVFFVQGHGGTLVRQIVLGSAILMLVLSAVLLRSGDRRDSAFARWYSLALLLMAVGLFAVMIQSVQASLLGWTGRGAQMLGGLYMLAAAVAARREFGESGIPLPAPETVRYPYAVALAVVLAATVIRLAFMSDLGTRYVYVVFYPAVLFAALYGGLRPGLFAMGLTLLVTNYLWIPPAGLAIPSSREEVVGIFMFIGTAGLMCCMGWNARRAQRRAEAAEREVAAHRDRLEEMVEARTAELEKKEKILRSVLQAVTESIWVWDRDGRVILANDTALARHGQPFSAVLGRSLRELVPDAMGEARMARLREVAETKAPVRWEDDRVDIRFAHTAYPVLDEAGEVACTASFSLDVTRERRAEEALRTSEARLKTIVEHLAEGLIVVGPEGSVLHWNRRALALHGYEHMEDLLVRFADLSSRYEVFTLGGEVVPVERWPIPRLMRGETVADHELMVRRRDIAWERVFSYDGVLVRDDGGMPVMGLLTIRDVTEKKRIEEGYRLAAQALENAAEGVVISRRGRVVNVNRAFTRITGYSEAEVLGQPFGILHSTPDTAEQAAMRKEAVDTAGAWEGEIWGRRRSGEVYPAWVRISAVDDEGRGRHYVSVFSDISHAKAAEARLDYLAHHDVLTGLANRTSMHARLEDTLARAQRHGACAAVLFVDLDHFKPVNDTLGHGVGDELLQTIAQRLKGSVRKTDLVARVGGDEFVLVLDELKDTEEAAWVAQNVVNAIARAVHLAGHPVYVSASVGIACYPADGKTGETLLRHADAAMYRAKEEGRNSYRFFSHGMDSNARERLFLISNLRSALERNELFLAYQPRVAAASGELLGVEALVRWRSPDHGLILPDRFIGFAEETGIIEPLGDWVLKHACEQFARWREQGRAPGFVSVNISARQFGQPRLAEKIRSILAVANMSPEQLELEVTESVVMANPEKARKALSQLAGLGVRLSLDDFGTGHSSLAYLQRFPVGQLKIDRSFVRDLPGDKDAANITKAIIALARNLELGITAEGVETEAQREFLERAGCEALQGYLFSEPVAPEELARFLGAGEAVAPGS